MFTLSMDKKPIEQLENDLDKFHDRAMPFAVKDTLNTVAFKTAALAKRNVRRLFTIRNTFTEKSIQFRKAFGTQINQMESSAGSALEYMEQQEEGFMETSGGKHGVVVPTSYAAGQEGAKPRTKSIRRVNWTGRMKVAKSPPRAGLTKRARLFVQVQEAVNSGNRVIFYDSQRPRQRGFYKVLGGRKGMGGKHGWPKGAHLKMLYNVSKHIIPVKARPWLEPVAERILKRYDEIYRAAIIRQIEINRLFKDKG